MIKKWGIKEAENLYSHIPEFDPTTVKTVLHITGVKDVLAQEVQAAIKAHEKTQDSVRVTIANNNVADAKDQETHEAQILKLKNARAQRKGEREALTQELKDAVEANKARVGDLERLKNLFAK